MPENGSCFRVAGPLLGTALMTLIVGMLVLGVSAGNGDDDL